MAAVDVVAKLEGLAAAHKEKLNWKTSIVDLLKLLGLDSSLTARKELATELKCPTEKMADSAQMNMWLHKTVLRKAGRERRQHSKGTVELALGGAGGGESESRVASARFDLHGKRI